MEVVDTHISTLSSAQEAFWEKEAHALNWFAPWKKILDWQAPYAKWYCSGKLNACYNCLDRHMNTPTRRKTALLWEGERGEERSFTYEELYHAVNTFSNGLKKLGVKKGDRVAIYLPHIPEAVIALLSCARIGAVHTVVFGGFSSDALKDRILDAEARVVITADGGFRKGAIVPLKEAVDVAIQDCPTVEHVVIIPHTRHKVPEITHKDVWYPDLIKSVPDYCPCEEMDAEDLLFILYTSGTTGKPKGIMHTTGGYMVGATSTTKRVFEPRAEDIYWCTADVGWITGHTYVVYGPLANGMTQLLYEGVFDKPERDRAWRLIEKYNVSIFYTAPTAIRTFMKWGETLPHKYDLSSLRLLGSVGEPINPEVWEWYFTHIGNKKCPVLDTWWQTETGSIMIAPTTPYKKLKPGSATFPLPGIEAATVDDKGEPVTEGYLALMTPWPSMLRGIYKDPQRYEKTYWKGKKPYYFTGDGAKQDEEGYFWLQGRVDDVINVSGHRLSTFEIESAVVDHQDIAESAAVAVSHSVKGQAVTCFAVLKESAPNEEWEEIVKKHVAQRIGAIARPERVILISELPKTRSGKIMRRLLRDIAEGRVVGDTSTLSDPEVIQAIKEKYVNEE